MSNKPDYANWVTKKLLITLGIGSAFSIILFALSFLFKSSIAIIIVRIILLLVAVSISFMFFYMLHAQKLLSYNGGGVQRKILDIVLNNLEWDGEVLLIDIGCGSGTMTIKAAKKYNNAQIIGMDYWGKGWDYAKEQCETNAKLEGVSDHVIFQKGDAAHLDFPNDYFDAAISNFVFHEVKSEPDKVALIKEAFRTIKPGGVFSFEDVFFSKNYYPDFSP